MAKNSKEANVAPTSVDATATSQGEGAQEIHVVTQETLDANPDLVGVVDIDEEIVLGDAVNYVVVSAFRCANNFNKEYEVGEDVSHFDADRIKRCEQLGLIKKV